MGPPFMKAEDGEIRSRQCPSPGAHSKYPSALKRMDNADDPVYNGYEKAVLRLRHNVPYVVQ